MKKYFKIARYLDITVTLAALLYGIYCIISGDYFWAAVSLVSAAISAVCVKYPPGEYLAKRYLPTRLS